MPEQPDYSKVLWAANGSPYWSTASGSKVYITPAVAMSMWNEPKALDWAKSKGFYIDGGLAGLSRQPTVVNGVVQQAPNPVHGKAPDNGFWRTDPVWSGEKGDWDSGFNWEHLLDLGVGGFAGAGLAAGIAAGGTAAGSSGTLAGAAGSAGTGSGLGTAATIAKAALGAKTGGTMGAWDWIGPAINAGTQIYGANMQSNAAQASTEAGAAAQKYSADLQAKAQAEALAFARQQAETDWQNQELARSANYGQWNAREGRISDFGGSVGLPARQSPAYVPGIDPRFTSGGGTLAGAASSGGTAPSGNPSDPSVINAQLVNVYKSLGVAPTGPGSGPTDIAYMAQKVAETGGWTPQNASYWPQRIAQELAKARGGGGGAAAPQPIAGTLASAGPAYQSPLVTPALQLPGTLAGLLR